jgi:transcriptional regulator with XRE-family HTH domain
MQVIDFKKIKELREKKDFSQAEVAAFIGLSRPTYALVELGKSDLSVEQFLHLATYLKVRPEDLIPELNATTQEKLATFKQLILNCIQYGSDKVDHKITKTKLAKLVYLADFTWFYRNGVSISGLMYRSIQRGPVADDYFRVIDELFEDQEIAIEPNGTALLISSREPASHDRLSSSQVSLIKEIGERWRSKNTAEIVEFTHQQTPWRLSVPGGLISYKTILEENKDNLF